MRKTPIGIFYGQTFGPWCESPGANYAEPGWVSGLRREANSAVDCIVRAASAPLVPPGVQTRNLRTHQVLARALNVYENAAVQVALDTFLRESAQNCRPVAIVFDAALFLALEESDWDVAAAHAEEKSQVASPPPYLTTYS